MKFTHIHKRSVYIHQWSGRGVLRIWVSAKDKQLRKVCTLDILKWNISQLTIKVVYAHQSMNINLIHIIIFTPAVQIKKNLVNEYPVKNNSHGKWWPFKWWPYNLTWCLCLLTLSWLVLCYM